MRKCQFKHCGELHGYKWTNPDKPAKHAMIEEPYLYCSLTCAAYDGAFNVRTGYNQKRLTEVENALQFKTD